MNFEQYSKLSSKLQKEYDWRFKEKYSITNVFAITMVFFALFGIIAVSALHATMTNPDSDAAKLYFESARVILSLGFALWCVILFQFAIQLSLAMKQHVEYVTWKKTNNIR